MKLLVQIGISALIGAVCGFAIAFLGSDKKFTVTPYFDGIGFMLSGLALLLILFAIMKLYKLKKMSQKTYSGVEEDEADVVMYRQSTDYILFSTTGIVISLLALCFHALKPTSINYIGVIAAITVLIISYILSSQTMRLARLSDPSREMPKMSDPDISKKLLAIMDDGERHITLLALYKAFGIVKSGMVLIIVFAAIYSYVNDQSQMFSIILLSILFIAMNIVYLMTVRKQAI